MPAAFEFHHQMPCAKRPSQPPAAPSRPKPYHTPDPFPHPQSLARPPCPDPASRPEPPEAHRLRRGLEQRHHHLTAIARKHRSQGRRLLQDAENLLHQAAGGHKDGIPQRRQVAGQDLARNVWIPATPDERRSPRYRLRAACAVGTRRAQRHSLVPPRLSVGLFGHRHDVGDHLCERGWLAQAVAGAGEASHVLRTGARDREKGGCRAQLQQLGVL